MLQTQIEDAVEALIDKVGVTGVVTALAAVCEGKAQHIEENWQDHSLSRCWGNAAHQLAIARTKLPLVPGIEGVR